MIIPFIYELLYQFQLLDFIIGKVQNCSKVVNLRRKQTTIFNDTLIIVQLLFKVDIYRYGRIMPLIYRRFQSQIMNVIHKNGENY